MKHVYPLLAVFLLFSLGVSATDNPGSAPLVVMQNWFPSDGVTSYTASALGATGSGYTVCNGISEDDDMWLRFTAVTVGAKVTVQNPAFDAVIELFNNSLVSVACVNTVAGNNTEILRHNTLIQGAQYYVRIHSLNGNGGSGTFNYAIEYLPQTEVRLNWYPNPNADIGLPGYRIYENTNRKIYTPVSDAALIQATRWLFIDTSNGIQHVGIKNGPSSLMLLDDIGDLCFGKTYDVYVEVQVEGYWCGNSVTHQVATEAVVTTELEPGYGAQYYDLNDYIKARYLGHNQLIEFELVTDNYQTTVLHDTVSSYCFFTFVDCIRYNKIYQVRTRASYCGSPFGPWSAADYIITNPLPYTSVDPQWCGQTLFVGSTITCQYVWGTNQYAWQFAPIEPGDLTMTPIGPAIVVYTPHTSCYLNPIGLTYGQTYRVAAKPFLGFNNLDGCDDHQEGDYGPFCPITIFDPFLFTGGETDMALDPGSLADRSALYRNDSDPFLLSRFASIRREGTSGALSVDLRQMEVSGEGRVLVHDSQGKLVASETFQRLEYADFLLIPLTGSLASGLYVVTLQIGAEQFSEKLWTP